MAAVSYGQTQGFDLPSWTYQNQEPLDIVGAIEKGIGLGNLVMQQPNLARGRKVQKMQQEQVLSGELPITQAQTSELGLVQGTMQDRPTYEANLAQQQFLQQQREAEAAMVGQPEPLSPVDQARIELINAQTERQRSMIGGQVQPQVDVAPQVIDFDEQGNPVYAEMPTEQTGDIVYQPVVDPYTKQTLNMPFRRTAEGNLAPVSTGVKPPSGFGPTPEGGFGPMPGTKEATAREQMETKEVASLQADISQGENINKQIDSIVTFGDEAEKSWLSPSGKFATFVAQNVPLQTDASTMQDLMATIKADQAFNRLAEMRRNSPTGGALGNVSNIELQLLASATAPINETLPWPKLKESLMKIKDARVKLMDMWKAKLAARGQTFEDAFNIPQDGETQQQPPATTGGIENAPMPTTATTTAKPKTFLGKDGKKYQDTGSGYKLVQ
jgi:hypothetical protein